MQRTVPLFILTVTGKFMPKDLLYQNRVPSTMCHKRIQGRYSMLELDEGKLSRPVLRRGVRGNSDPLADRGARRVPGRRHRGCCHARDVGAGAGPLPAGDTRSAALRGPAAGERRGGGRGTVARACKPPRPSSMRGDAARGTEPWDRQQGSQTHGADAVAWDDQRRAGG